MLGQTRMNNPPLIGLACCATVLSVNTAQNTKPQHNLQQHNIAILSSQPCTSQSSITSYNPLPQSPNKQNTLHR